MNKLYNETVQIKTNLVYVISDCRGIGVCLLNDNEQGIR